MKTESNKKITLVIINEKFEEMILGKNSTLSYILAAAALGDEIFIYNIENKNDAFDLKENFLHAQTLSSEIKNKLIKFYKEYNLQIVDHVSRLDYEGLSKIKFPKVFEVLEKEELDFLSKKIAINISEISNVIQRLEPMKSPFPPQGNENLLSFLVKIKKIFPRHIFNCPIFEISNNSYELLQDKGSLYEISKILLSENDDEISTPTLEFDLEDAQIKISEIVKNMREKYRALSINKSSQSEKIVIKPKDSAQSLGVFALEFVRDEGLDLEKIKSSTLENLTKLQLYKINEGKALQGLKEIIETLCYVQRIKSSKKIFEEKAKKKLSEFSRIEIINSAKELYQTCLAQPFLEGVRDGDVRANIAKNEDGNFYLAGITFRSSIVKKSDAKFQSDFTTSYSSGAATSKPVSSLPKSQQDDLKLKIEKILRVLNSSLKEKYKNVTEAGIDFIAADNGKVFAGEINHSCPALLPIAEAMEEVQRIWDKKEDVKKYDGGIGLAREALSDQKYCHTEL